MKALRIVAALCCLVLVSFLSEAKTPKGHLVIVGGGGRTDKIGQAYIQYSGAPEATFLVIGTASDTPMEAAESFAASIKKMGAGETRCIAPTRAECNDPEYVNKVMEGVGGVFFCGGKQHRITDAIRGTLLHERLMKLYEEGGMISGSSAGAAMMSEKMLTGSRVDHSEEGFKDIAPDMVEIVEGMGFIKGAIIDQHFLKRSRENRLFSVAFDHPECVCIGIDEATAIVVSKGRDIEVLGRSSVMIIEPDRKSIRVDKNYNYAGNARIKLLFEGDKYRLKK
ncbi:MAG: cyanophycinase [Bacteroidales bacterium]|nr:cyanophycinase [Bacteroidales bacterium]